MILFHTLLAAICEPTYTLVVDDLDDNSEAAVLELENASDLHVSPRAGTDLNFCHFICRLN